MVCFVSGRAARIMAAAWCTPARPGARSGAGGGLWSRLDTVQKLEARIAFYEMMNAKLDFRFNHIVKPLVSARRKELAAARSIAEIVQRTLPPAAVVLVMSMANQDLRQFQGYQARVFPDRSSKPTQRLFASGSAGSGVTPPTTPSATVLGEVLARTGGGAPVGPGLAVLASGWRYHGRPSLPITIGVGLIAGLGSGAVQIAGPAVIMGTELARTARAWKSMPSTEPGIEAKPRLLTGCSRTLTANL